MLHKGQPRFSITSKEIYSFVIKLWGLLREEVYYLIYNWVLSHKIHTKEEVQRLELIFGKEHTMELINYVEITKPKHTEILKTCRDLDKYIEFLKNDVRLYPTRYSYPYFDLILAHYKKSNIGKRSSNKEVLDFDKLCKKFFEKQLEKLRNEVSALFTSDNNKYL